ncbi:acetyl-CoA synthetase-like protein [Dentipellis sp. KUC8613]|nr:acetyl-CoA synthetase-like protein [Dentipellis sp. KUC8613]
MTWVPRRSLAETQAILCAPGQIHEYETRLIEGRLQRVYKNLWPSLRDFWLWVADQYKDLTYVVFEQQRITYSQAFERSLKVAAMFKTVYGVQKGDRVIICSRNYPDYIVAFWACHLIGAVAVLVNAWLPLEPTKHCLLGTQCKLVIVDTQRADLLEGHSSAIRKAVGTTGFLVWEHHEGKGKWDDMQLWSDALASFNGDPRQVLRDDPGLVPEDNATIIFTSGTTGLPKGVLSTHRMFLTNLFNLIASSRRAALRRGESLTAPPTPTPETQGGILISVPLFHVTGSTSMSMIATFTGMKIVFMRKWVPDEGSRLILTEKLTAAGGVPSMVSDLINSSPNGLPLASLLFGGAPAPDWLVEGSRAAFPNAAMSQAYGLTETNSVAVGFAGEDYAVRPTSAGLPAPVCDILIVKDGKVLPAGEQGEVWLRGPNVMKGYWGDPAATAAAITQDGWLRTGDVGFVDHEGFLYIRDRIKDLIIRGGENIDSVSVENAVSADDRLLEVAAVAVPDKRLGELVAVVASVKAAYQGKVKEEEVIAIARKRLPRFAVPVMIVLLDDRLARTPSGKILKGELRQLAKDEWLKRLKANKGTPAAAKL